MFGSTTEFFFRHVLGIQQQPGTKGFASIHFQPSVLLSTQYLQVCNQLKSSNGTLRRPHGDISAGWVCDGTSVTYTVATPVGVDAVVYYPLSSKGAKTPIFEGDAKVWDGNTFVGSTIPGIISAETSPQGNSVMISIHSGSYSFDSTSLPRSM